MGAMLGIDVGGTFTDFIEIGGSEGIRIAKVPSVPANPAEGVLAGLAQLAAGHASLGAYLSGIDLVVHGTTIATNAIIMRRHAKTGYITTKGFRDFLNSRRGLKRSAFTAKEAPPEPIVPQYLVRTVDERVDRNGTVVTPLNEDDIRAAAAHFRREGVEAVAVCYMFSFLNPAHEARTKTILNEELPDVYVTLSSDVLPQARLYERGSTTVFNGCVGPLLRKYIDALIDRLNGAGFRGRFLTMQSNGGVMPPEVVKEFGANTLLSGPASGPVAGLFFAKGYGLAKLVTVDMGGTSFDACLIRDGRPAVTSRCEVAEYALALPALDINAIGAGGGSIARVEDGILRVGPESAGSVPGPACYGLGGQHATVTDADLVLGYLDADYFLGGQQRLDTLAAARCLRDSIATPLDVSTIQAALGVVRIVDANMADGVRAVSVARGFDVRDACLIAAGGAGPLHACGIATELEMDLILVPRPSSVFCASGMLTTDLRQDVVRHADIPLRHPGEAVAAINRLREELLERGKSILARENVQEAQRELAFSGDMLFEGQFNATETPLPMLAGPVQEKDLTAIRQAFETMHELVYGYVLDGEPVEIQSLRLTAIGRRAVPSFPRLRDVDATSGDTKKGARLAWFSNKATVTPVYDGMRLYAGCEIGGPALIEQPTTTIKIAPRWRARVDEHGNLLLWRIGTDLDDILARFRQQRD